MPVETWTPPRPPPNEKGWVSDPGSASALREEAERLWVVANLLPGVRLAEAPKPYPSAFIRLARDAQRVRQEHEAALADVTTLVTTFRDGYDQVIAYCDECRRLGYLHDPRPHNGAFAALGPSGGGLHS
jgi:hypothetical protein